MTRIRPSAVVQSSIPAILVFILIDTALEYLAKRLFGLSLLDIFERQTAQSYGMRFHATNLVLFILEMQVVMGAYACIRPTCATMRAAVTTTSALLVLLITLFVGQMVNLGIYPPGAAMVFLATTIGAFPLSIVTGAMVYERVTRD